MLTTCNRPGCQNQFDVDGHGHGFMVFVPARNTNVPVCSDGCMRLYKEKISKEESIKKDQELSVTEHIL